MELLKILIEITTLIFLGFISIYLFKRFVSDNLNMAFLSVLFLTPIVLFGIKTNLISEFSGFGVSAKLSSKINEPISTYGLKKTVKDISLEDRENRAIVSYPIPRGTPEDVSWHTCIEYLIIRPEKIPNGGPDLETYFLDITETIRASITCGKFKGILVLDKDSRYLGSFSSGFFIEIVSAWAVPNDPNEPEDKSVFVERVRTYTQFGSALLHPVERIESGEGFKGAVNEKHSLLLVLKKFDEIGEEFLVVTDTLGRYQGLIEREDIVNDFLMYLLDDVK